MRRAAAVLRPLLAAERGKPFVNELERFRKVAQAAAAKKAIVAGSSAGQSVPGKAEDSPKKKEEVEAAEVREVPTSQQAQDVGAADATGAGAVSSEGKDRSAPDQGREKQAEFWAKATVLVKQLLQAINAPGKGD